MCPVYMAYGMTYEEYWHGEMEMAKAYREAHKIRLKEQNTFAHRQGAYFYEAIVKGIACTFGKSKEYYSAIPYPMTDEEAEEREAAKRQQEYEEMKTRMMNRFANINKKKRGE